MREGPGAHFCAQALCCSAGSDRSSSSSSRTACGRSGWCMRSMLHSVDAGRCHVLRRCHAPRFAKCMIAAPIVPRFTVGTPPAGATVLCTQVLLLPSSTGRCFHGCQSRAAAVASSFGGGGQARAASAAGLQWRCCSSVVDARAAYLAWSGVRFCCVSVYPSRRFLFTHTCMHVAAAVCRPALRKGCLQCG